LALDDLSFSLDSGQIVGVVGLNGAGKTTLLKSICNLLEPSAGTIVVAGHPLPRAGAAVRAIVGYVPNDDRSFFWRLTGQANLEFFAGLYGMAPASARRRIAELLEMFGLAGKAGHRFSDYSSGMRKRLAIARGLLHGPRILVLDEPTNSLDLQWDNFLRGFVRQWVCAEPGRLVLWSTHRMEEVSDLCQGVIGLAQGRLAYCGEAAGAGTFEWMAASPHNDTPARQHVGAQAEDQ
jgi:sodium transport system ATP-binding protein